MSASLIHRVKPFATEGEDNCEAARFGGEQSFAVSTGRNESEPHLMSLEKCRTSKPNLFPMGEGRWAGTVANPGSPRKGLNGWRPCIVLAGSARAACREVMLEEAGRSRVPVETQIQHASGECHEVLDGNREVGVTHSSVEGAVTALKRRRGTWSMRTKK